MQILETARAAYEKGDYGERRVEILLNIGESPITLNTRFVVHDKDRRLDGTLHFPVDRKRGQWARNNPREQARFNELNAQGRSFSMVVHPSPLIKPELARVGWLTSAYLMAFYSFG